MSIRQAGSNFSDEELDAAYELGLSKRLAHELAWCRPGVSQKDKVKCRFYPKLSFFFDGTGNNLYQEMRKDPEFRELTNIARLYQAAQFDKQSTESFPTYIAGVGTPYSYLNSDPPLRPDKGGKLGLGFGSGGQMRLDAAKQEFRRILKYDLGQDASNHIQLITEAPRVSRRLRHWRMEP